MVTVELALSVLPSLPSHRPHRSILDRRRRALTHLLRPVACASHLRSGSGIGSLAQLIQSDPTLFPPSLFAAPHPDAPPEEVALANAARIFSYVRSVYVATAAPFGKGPVRRLLTSMAASLGRTLFGRVRCQKTTETDTCPASYSVRSRSFLITHAHLDHVSSLILGSGGLPPPRSPDPAAEAWMSIREVYGSMDTLLNLETVFGEKVWPDIAGFPHKEEDNSGKVLRFVELVLPHPLNLLAPALTATTFHSPTEFQPHHPPLQYHHDLRPHRRRRLSGSRLAASPSLQSPIFHHLL